MARKIIAEPMADQLKFMFSDISQSAGALVRMIIEHTATDDEETKEYLLYAAEALGQRIGWTADLGTKKLGGVLIQKGDAEDWMMCPAYHSAIKDAEVSHA
jgi:hypothetical protein